MENYSRLRAKVKTLRTARAALVKAVEEELPAGVPVQWMHGRHKQYGHVTRHGYGGDLWAENHRTCREVRLTIHKILDAR